MKTRPILWYIALVLTMALGYVGGHFDSLAVVAHRMGPSRVAEPEGLPLEQRQRTPSKPDIDTLAAQLVSGQFNTVPPTFASGSSIPIQTDSAGRLITVASGGTVITGPLGAQAQAASVAITDSLQLPAALGAQTGANSFSVVSASGAAQLGLDSSLQSIVTNTTGLATQATLSALNAKFNSLGQKTMANSAPMVIASDQSAIPVSGTVTANVVGATTPTDTFANPTNTVPATDFEMVWNGATWDRHKGTAGVGTVCGGTGCDQLAKEQGNLQTLSNNVANDVGNQSGSLALGTQYAQFGAELSKDQDIGTAKSKNVKGGLNGTFHQLACSVDTTAVGVTWLMFVNKGSAPVNGDLPAYPAVPMIAGGHYSIGPSEIGDGGIVASIGLSWALSSTPFVVTLTGNAANLFNCFIEYH